MTEDEGGGSPVRPRFPAVRVAVSAAGIAVASWLWLGSGYRWDVTPKELLESRPPLGLRSGWADRYVRLHGTFRRLGLHGPDLDAMADAADPSASVFIRVPRGGASPEDGRGAALTGRVVPEGNAPVLDTTRGRWNATSVIAVVVGLWGVALLCAHVSGWRRAARARAGPQMH
jgi:hypothetical protein